MKNRTLFSLFAAFFCVFVLAACGKDPSSSEVPPPSTEPPIEEPVLLDADQFFENGVFATYKVQVSSINDQNGVKRDFTALLDRQLDVFTQDLIYRLLTIYGVGTPNVNQTIGTYGENALALTDPLTSEDFAKGANKALVTDYKLIANPTTATTSTVEYRYSNGTVVKSGAESVVTPDITQAASFAYALRGGKWDTTITLGQQLNLTQAINGGYAFEGGTYTQTLNASGSWLMKNSQTYVTSDALGDPTALYEDFVGAHFINIKTAVANILAKGSDSGLTYAQALESISSFGFTNANATTIKEYVLNKVIGQTNRANDNSNKPANEITENSVTPAGRNYRAYQLIVGEVVNQAVSNTFNNTSESLWLSATRIGEESTFLEMDKLEEKNFTQIKLISSKTNTPVSEIVFKVGGVNLNSLNIELKIYSSSSSLIGSVATPTSQGSDGKVTINMRTYKSNTLTTGAYIVLNFSHKNTTAIEQSPFTISNLQYYNK